MARSNWRTGSSKSAAVTAAKPATMSASSHHPVGWHRGAKLQARRAARRPYLLIHALTLPAWYSNGGRPGWTALHCGCAFLESGAGDGVEDVLRHRSRGRR